MTQFIPFANPGSYKPNAAPITDPTGYSFLMLDDTTFVPTTIAPGNLPGGFPFVTVGATGATYTSIGAAISAGNYNIYVINACTESADVNIGVDGEYHIWFAPNASDDFGGYKINILNSTIATIRIWDGALLFSYASTQDFITYTGSGTGSLYMRGVRFVNTSTADDCHVNGTPSFAGPTQNFVNCTVELPDQANCGLQFAAGIGMDLTLVSGGSNCYGAITASRGQFAAIKFQGAQWSSGVVASFGASTVNGLLVTSESGTPSVRIWALGSSTLQGIYAEGTSSFVVILLSNTSISNFDTGGAGTIFLASSSGSSAISNGTCVQNLVSSNGAQAKFSNVRFTSSVGIEAAGSLFTSCDFDGDTQIRASNVHLSCVNGGAPGGLSGNTFTLVPGVEGCSIIGSNSEIPVVDASGNATNTLLANSLW
jgi:hypothetical protein